MWCTFYRHHPAAETIGRLNGFAAKAEGVKYVEIGVAELRVGYVKKIKTKFLTQSPFIEYKTDIECVSERVFQELNSCGIEAFFS